MAGTVPENGPYSSPKDEEEDASIGEIQGISLFKKVNSTIIPPTNSEINDLHKYSNQVATYLSGKQGK